MGEILYDAVLEESAKIIVDIGILNGYSTVCLARAAKHTGGRVYAYDLFDDYQYNSADIEQVKHNLALYNVSDVVDIKKMSLDDWLKEKQEFDILHVDVSNTGETIEKLYDQLSCRTGRVFFEGGSLTRDIKQDWVNKYNTKKFSDVDKKISFRLLKEDVIKSDSGRIFYPSISELYINNNGEEDEKSIS